MKINRKRQLLLSVIAIGPCALTLSGCATDRHARSIAQSFSTPLKVDKVRGSSPDALGGGDVFQEGQSLKRQTQAAFRLASASLSSPLARIAQLDQREELPAPEGNPLKLEAAETANPKEPKNGEKSQKEETQKTAESDAEDKNEEGNAKSGLPEPVALDSLTRVPANALENQLPLTQVIASVQSFYPLLRVAYLERNRTSGDQLAAWGSFDTKVKGYTENQPLGFYENYQHGAGVYQPLYQGGEVYSTYRIGRGIFEPWYLERETNKGGEFKAGFALPLLRNRDIDARRAQLWRATYDRQLAEPGIRQEIIQTIRDASMTYWDWVAAGRQYEIGKAALQLAQQRNRQVSRRVEEGDLGEPSLKDNAVAIAKREGKLVDLERKLLQTSVKLSLFLRGTDGTPLIPEMNTLPTFPEIVRYDNGQLENDISYAIANRPELVALDTLARRTQVDLAEACNDTLPNLDALANASQDVGERTSSKGDKSEFELELGVVFEMPVQRRKGLGKARSARAKIQQIVSKRQFTVEKIAAQVQGAAAGLDAAFERIERIREAVRLAESLAKIERRKFELGESDLLAVFLREQIAIESASDLVIAQRDYFIAQSEYTAALAYQFPILFEQP